MNSIGLINIDVYFHLCKDVAFCKWHRRQNILYNTINQQNTVYHWLILIYILTLYILYYIIIIIECY